MTGSVPGFLSFRPQGGHIVGERSSLKDNMIKEFIESIPVKMVVFDHLVDKYTYLMLFRIIFSPKR
jgi:hypothetical protein